MLAAVAAYYSLADLLRDSDVTHYIDNSSAVAALVKGYSSKPDSARIVHALWALMAGISCSPWFSYVRTKANVADFPSRDDVTYVRDILGGKETEFKMPPFSMWSSVHQALEVVARLSPAEQSAHKRRRRR